MIVVSGSAALFYYLRRYPRTAIISDVARLLDVHSRISQCQVADSVDGDKLLKAIHGLSSSVTKFDRWLADLGLSQIGAREKLKDLLAQMRRTASLTVEDLSQALDQVPQLCHKSLVYAATSSWTATPRSPSVDDSFRVSPQRSGLQRAMPAIAVAALGAVLLLTAVVWSTADAITGLTWFTAGIPAVWIVLRAVESYASKGSLDGS